MEVIEIHLAHGFLGLPEDWKVFKEVLLGELKGAGVLCRFHSYNLWDDFADIIKAGPHGDKNYLNVWAENKKRQILRSQEKKFFIGYSLGGRLLSHLHLQEVDKVQGVALIATHPGFPEESQRKQRLLDDCFWSERFIDEQWNDLMNAWDAQSVFSHDKNRPLRKEARYDRKILARYFKEWSLGIQHPQDKMLSSAGAPYYWFCGEKDSKYAPLLPRMKKLIGPNHCFKVEDSGHGCHWDNPWHLAKLLAPLIQRG